jgi:hypothetical protein
MPLSEGLVEQQSLQAGAPVVSIAAGQAAAIYAVDDVADHCQPSTLAQERVPTEGDMGRSASPRTGESPWIATEGSAETVEGRYATQGVEGAEDAERPIAADVDSVQDVVSANIALEANAECEAVTCSDGWDDNVEAAHWDVTVSELQPGGLVPASNHGNPEVVIVTEVDTPNAASM